MSARASIWLPRACSGGDIVHRPQSLLGQGGLGGGHDPGDAEVGHLDAAVPEDHDVLGLDVPVDDPPAVGVCSRARTIWVMKCRDSRQFKRPCFFCMYCLRVIPSIELHDDIIQVVALCSRRRRRRCWGGRAWPRPGPPRGSGGGTPRPAARSRLRILMATKPVEAMAVRPCTPPPCRPPR